MTDKFLVGDVNNCGYRRVGLYSKPYKKRYFIHRLVALYFVDGFAEDLQINHKDGDKTNNNCANLEWVTQSQNEQHKQKFLNPRVTNKEVIQAMPDGSEIEFFQVSHCALFNNIGRRVISAMLTGRKENKLNVRYKTVV
ncbi:MAG: HNH endonuclease signature motif containing protein [Cetobacterium sp.]